MQCKVLGCWAQGLWCQVPQLREGTARNPASSFRPHKVLLTTCLPGELWLEDPPPSQCCHWCSPPTLTGPGIYHRCTAQAHPAGRAPEADRCACGRLPDLRPSWPPGLVCSRQADLPNRLLSPQTSHHPSLLPGQSSKSGGGTAGVPDGQGSLDNIPSVAPGWGAHWLAVTVSGPQGLQCPGNS